MKVIEVIAEWTLPKPGNWIDDAGTGIRNMGTSVIRGVGNALGRGARFRKAEDLAPEIADLAKAKGRPLTNDEIAKHISNSHPGLADELADALKDKQKTLDFNYQKSLDTWNAQSAKYKQKNPAPVEPPAVRLTTAEETAIRSKPEYQPDPKLVNDVESKANVLISKANRAEAVKAIAPVAKWTGVIVELGIDTALAAQIISPFTEYYAKLGDAKEYWNAKQIGPGAPASIKTPEQWYIWYTDKALGDAILKSGALFIAAAIIKFPFKLFSWIANKFEAKGIAKIIALGTTAGTAILISKFFNKDADVWWGSLFANALGFTGIDIDGDLSRLVGGAVTHNIPDMAQRMTSIGFRAPTKIAEWFRSLTGMENAADEFAKPAADAGTTTAAGQPVAGTTTASGQPVAGTTTASGQPVAGTAATTAGAPAADTTDKKAAQQGFTDLGGGWLKDPATGKIYPKIQESR